MTPLSSRLDPVTLNIVGRTLDAIAEEMGVNLVRGAFSPLIRETRDISMAVLSPRGEIVGMAQYVPILLNAMGPAFEGWSAEYSPEALEPGEVIVMNDPFRGGQHLNDVFLFVPVFVEGILGGFVANVAHHTDLGGGAPSGNADATEVFQEGIVIPPMKLDVRDGWETTPLVRMILANVRMPETTLGDLRAQFAASRIAAARLGALFAKYGAAVVHRCMDELLARSERLMREAIGGLPEGTYRGEASLEDDGVAGKPLTVRVALTIADGDLVVDLSDTDAQIQTFSNSTLGSTVSTVHTTILSVLGGPHIPKNGGCFRPVRIVAPLGTAANPRRPAPSRARTNICYRIFDAIVAALMPVAVDRIPAPGFNSQTGISLSRYDGGRWRVFHDVITGGNGARECADGADGMTLPLTNSLNTPIEATELEFDFLRIVRYGLRPDSGGAGTFRGGLGIERVYEVLEDGIRMFGYSDRHLEVPPGFHGGLPGATGRFAVERDGRVTRLSARVNTLLGKGDRLIVWTGGGSGFGSPTARDGQRLEQDVRNGLITRELARSHRPEAV